MKEITTEIKRRVFGLYYGQRIMRFEGWPEGETVEDIHGNVHRGHEVAPHIGEYGAYLEVKPLSCITDEDAAELNAMHNWTKGVHGTKYWYQDEADYLRSKGYALPYMDWSVDKLVEAGVFKLRKEQQ